MNLGHATYERTKEVSRLARGETVFKAKTDQKAKLKKKKTNSEFRFAVCKFGLNMKIECIMYGI